MALRLLFLLALQAVIAKTDSGNAAKAALYPRQGIPPACSTWSYFVSFCKSASPGFVELPGTKQVPCLCYDELGGWYPDIFDNAVDDCASWAATADVSEYTVVDSWQGICTDVGNILAAPGSTPALNSPTPTPAKPSPTHTPVTASTTAAPTPKASDGCSAFGSFVASCSSNTPGFLDMSFGAIAACVCYTSSTSWVPARFDSAAASCANVFKTGDPTDYPQFTADFLNFCTEVGDVVNTPDTPLSPTVTRTASPKTTARKTSSNSITPVPTTDVLGSTPTPVVSTKLSSALRLLAYEGSMKVLSSSCLIVTLAVALF